MRGHLEDEEERRAVAILTGLLNRPDKIDDAEVQAVMADLEQWLGPYLWSVADPSAPFGIRTTEAENVRRAR